MLATAASIILVVAFSAAATTLPPASECQTPPVQCCTTLAPATNPTVAMVLAGLGIVPEHPDEFAGLTCTAINGTVGPNGNGSCAVNFSPVCCGQLPHNPSGIAVDCVLVDRSA